jgi:hypothetical protein
VANGCGVDVKRAVVDENAGDEVAVGSAGAIAVFRVAVVVAEGGRDRGVVAVDTGSVFSVAALMVVQPVSTSSTTTTK